MIHVKGDQGIVIHLVNVVAGEDQHKVSFGVLNKAEILLYSVGSAEIPI